MTTPRPHAELAARYMADSTLKCWVNGTGREWIEVPHMPNWEPHYEYHVGHEPPPIKRTITLVVNGRTWVLPEPLRENVDSGRLVWFLNWDKRPTRGRFGGTFSDHGALIVGQFFATEADAQAWAEFDKWCRGGGV